MLSFGFDESKMYDVGYTPIVERSYEIIERYIKLVVRLIVCHNTCKF